jgi:hypothetical protein
MMLRQLKHKLCRKIFTVNLYKGIFIVPFISCRIAFAYYVATKKITEMRRYSVGKIFEEGYFSPTETQECIFQSISPEPNDFVNDAEILFTGKEICDKIFPNDKNQIRFYVNHGIIFWAVLKRCQITQKSVTLFMNLMMNRPVIIGFTM